MEEVRVFKLKKYMEFAVGESSIENKFEFINIPEESILGLDLSLNAELFYGLKAGNILYVTITNIDEFKNYDAIFRLLSWSRIDGKGEYIFRVLKSNNNEQVDFKEEREYLKSFRRII